MKRDLTQLTPTIIKSYFLPLERFRKKLSLILLLLLLLPPVPVVELSDVPFFDAAVLLSLAVVVVVVVVDVGTRSPFTSSDKSSVLSDDDGTT